MAGRIKPPLPTQSRAFARGLRRSSTDAERRLWYHLRGGRLGGYKFRRQHEIPPYIVDFYCEVAKLVVELDGSQHESEIDAVRTHYLNVQGLEVVRFWDDEVLSKKDAVLESILTLLQSRTLTPGPSPDGRGEKSRNSSQ